MTRSARLAQGAAEAHDWRILTLPATLSIAVAAIGLLLAALTFGVSAGPGWRALRWFGMCALIASAYTATNAAFTLDVSPRTLELLSRASLTLGGVHGVAWLHYYAANERRGLLRWERALAVVGLGFALVAPLPNVLYSSELHWRPVPWLGVVYRDVLPTRLGVACFVFYIITLSVILVRYVLDWRARVPYAGAHVLGIALLLVGATNDACAAGGLVDMPYLVDLGFLGLMISVGSALTRQFVRSARDLETAVERLRQTRDALVARERLAAIGEMSAVVAHEVRNPVGVIFNALASLRRRPLEAPDLELVEIVQEEADHLRRMVTDLLDYAHPRELQPAKTPLQRLCASAIEAAERASSEEARRSRGRVPVADRPDEPEVEADIEPRFVQCDERLVRQAIINLVTNALQAEGRSGPVRVSGRASPDGKWVEIRVHDDGAGVSAEVAASMFKPFFTTRPSGTGLGLPLVQRVAEAHGGEVFHEPSSSGATFVLRLPASAQSDAPPA